MNEGSAIVSANVRSPSCSTTAPCVVACFAARTFAPKAAATGAAARARNVSKGRISSGLNFAFECQS